MGQAMCDLRRTGKAQEPQACSKHQCWHKGSGRASQAPQADGGRKRCTNPTLFNGNQTKAMVEVLEVLGLKGNLKRGKG